LYIIKGGFYPFGGIPNMKLIESAENAHIKIARRIAARKIPDLWMLEGRKLVSEGLEVGAFIEEVLVTNSMLQKEPELLEKIEAKQAQVFLVSEALMKKISGVETPPGIIAMVRNKAQVVVSAPDRFAVLLLSIRDPGNFGAILRVGEATGCDYVAYTSDCVDPYLPKTVRASGGSILRVRLAEISDVGHFLTENESRNVSTYALDAHNGEDLSAVKPQPPALLLIGSESHGLPAEMSVSRRIRIPMRGRIESLNAAVAAGIALYWFAKETQSMIKTKTRSTQSK
jgi:RNA methyltransferase, TrmH family